MKFGVRYVEEWEPDETIEADEFPTRDSGAGVWIFERSEQSAAGAGGKRRVATVAAGHVLEIAELADEDPTANDAS